MWWPFGSSSGRLYAALVLIPVTHQSSDGPPDTVFACMARGVTGMLFPVILSSFSPLSGHFSTKMTNQNHHFASFAIASDFALL
jgi:hypothetical protein